jgi:hypothetical protein
MTCHELGGACDKVFQAETFEEIAELSKQHGMEMFKLKDADHLQAMEKMKSLMSEPKAMATWYEQKRLQFEKLLDE